LGHGKSGRATALFSRELDCRMLRFNPIDGQLNGRRSAQATAHGGLLRAILQETGPWPLPFALPKSAA
jgi:hypothetical protein